jgi:hypothetical protein
MYLFRAGCITKPVADRLAEKAALTRLLAAVKGVSASFAADLVKTWL